MTFFFVFQDRSLFSYMLIRSKHIRSRDIRSIHRIHVHSSHNTKLRDQLQPQPHVSFWLQQLQVLRQVWQQEGGVRNNHPNGRK